MIEVSNIYKAFAEQSILEGVSLTIESGQSAVIIGRSGEGKSVLLKHLVGLLTPDSGHVRIDGQDLTGLGERALIEVRRKFGMVFQQAALFDSLSVEENVNFVLRREGRHTSAQMAKLVTEALEMVELRGVEKKRPAELSGGMRKRVGLARAIIYRPEIVLYDEPTTGLDPVVSDSIDKLILRINERLGVTTVVVTHDMRSARRIGQKVFFLNGGRIYADGSADDIFESNDPLVHRFVRGISDEKDLAL